MLGAQALRAESAMTQVEKKGPPDAPCTTQVPCPKHALIWVVAYSGRDGATRFDGQSLVQQKSHHL